MQVKDIQLAWAFGAVQPKRDASVIFALSHNKVDSGLHRWLSSGSFTAR